jgi:hypothetical protein
MSLNENQPTRKKGHEKKNKSKRRSMEISMIRMKKIWIARDFRVTSSCSRRVLTLQVDLGQKMIEGGISPVSGCSGNDSIMDKAGVGDGCLDADFI